MNTENGTAPKPAIHVSMAMDNVYGYPLEVGDRVWFNIFLEPFGGVIEHLRQVQLDFSRCVGLMVLRMKVRMMPLDHPRKPKLYYGDGGNEKYPHVYRWNYMALEPVEGKILNLTRQPVQVARVKVRILEENAVLSVLGPQPPSTNDEGVAFTARFKKDEEFYTLARGNVTGGLLTILAETGAE